MKKHAFLIILLSIFFIQNAHSQGLVIDPTLATCSIPPMIDIIDKADIVQNSINTNCSAANFHLAGQALAFYTTDDITMDAFYGATPDPQCDYTTPLSTHGPRRW